VIGTMCPSTRMLEPPNTVFSADSLMLNSRHVSKNARVCSRKSACLFGPRALQKQSSMSV